jgi:glutamine amidotransferase-like uncharacterized protein
MFRSEKVFIYRNPKFTCSESVDDLVKLFSSDRIFNHPDVQVGDLNFNASGLSYPTIVVPPGTATFIGQNVKPAIENIKYHLGAQFNYIGICAGAFVGAEDGDLCADWDRETLTRNNPAQHFLSLSDISANLNLISDYKSVGPFFPNDKEKELKKDIAHSATLNLESIQKKLPFLYVSGPGFFNTKKGARSSTEVVATYADCESYAFAYEEQREEITSLAAIVRKRQEKNQGSVLLSGVHIEACVKDSKFLRLFAESTPEISALKPAEHDQLVEQQEESQQIVETMLRETLRRA